MSIKVSVTIFDAAYQRSSVDYMGLQALCCWYKAVETGRGSVQHKASADVILRQQGC